MLKLEIPKKEILHDDGTLTTVGPYSLQLEHSLVSISKWEAKWCKPFLDKADKTEEEIMDYIKCMTISQNINDEAYKYLGKKNIGLILDHIDSKMTATWLPDKKGGGSREIVTSELIYYWMISLQIPFECQKWHLNRLLTLVQVCNIKNQPPKKQSRASVLSQQRALNEARRKQLNTTG
jgi:hypothetical protein